MILYILTFLKNFILVNLTLNQTEEQECQRWQLKPMLDQSMVLGVQVTTSILKG